MRNIGVLLVLLSVVLNVRADCPDGYMRHENSCYRFHHNVFTWPEAISLCRAYKSRLLTIETESEFIFVKAKAAEARGEGYWTGGSDGLVQNEWLWTETGERLTLVGDWAPGEPDHTQGRDCLGLWGNHGYQLSAWDCRHLLRPICEVE